MVDLAVGVADRRRQSEILEVGRGRVARRAELSRHRASGSAAGVAMRTSTALTRLLQIEILLQPGERDEDRQRRSLRRQQRELAELVALRRLRVTVSRIRSLTSSRRPCRLLSGMSVGLATRSSSVSSASAPSSAASPGSSTRGVRRRGAGSPVEREEAIVDAEDLHARGGRRLSSCVTAPVRASSGVGRRQRPVRSTARRSSASAVAKKAGRRQDEVGGAEPREREVAQACADRGADEQRAGQHRDRDGHAGDHQRVEAAIVLAGWRGPAGFMTTMSTAAQMPALDVAIASRSVAASGSLCVTTSRMVCWR